MFQEHVSLPKSWKLDDRIKNMVKHTCLYAFVESLTEHRQRATLFRPLLRTYRDNAFHIGTKKLYLGLEDVLYITGLPIVGEPIVPSEENCRDHVQEILGIDISADSQKDTCNIKLSTLRKEFETVPLGLEQDDLKKYAIGYLLYVIGTVVFSAFSKLVVPSGFVHLTKDLAAVNNYAWGAGLLAYTHHGLENFSSDAENPCFYGNGYLVMIFLLTHVPGLPKLFGVKRQGLPTSFPLIGPWTKLMKKKDKEIQKCKLLQSEVEEMNVCYQPYNNVVGMPEERMLELLICHIDTIVCCIDRSWVHKKEYFDLQLNFAILGPLGFEMSMPEEIPCLKLKTRKSAFRRDWKEFYEPYNKRWREFMENFRHCYQDNLLEQPQEQLKLVQDTEPEPQQQLEPMPEQQPEQETEPEGTVQQPRQPLEPVTEPVPEQQPPQAEQDTEPKETQASGRFRLTEESSIKVHERSFRGQKPEQIAAQGVQQPAQEKKKTRGRKLFNTENPPQPTRKSVRVQNQGSRSMHK